MKIKIITFLLLYMLFSTLVSCKLQPFPEEDDIEDDIVGNITEATELFSGNGEEFIFETNETKYLSDYGYTLWTLTECNESESFNAIDVDVYKSSGNPGAGFGVVFCNQEIEGKNYMLVVLINTKGQYLIGKVIDGNFQSFSQWKSSPYIRRGYGVVNNIKINYEDASFILRINGYEITKIKDSDHVVIKGSKSGYVAIIDRGESFPQVQVKIVYKKNGE